MLCNICKKTVPYIVQAAEDLKRLRYFIVNLLSSYVMLLFKISSENTTWGTFVFTLDFCCGTVNTTV